MASRPAQDIAETSVEEWAAIERGELTLPEGWSDEPVRTILRKAA